PACGQAVIAIETRVADHETRKILDNIHNKNAGLTSAAERAALQVLDGSCHTPIGAFAVMRGNDMDFKLAVASGDGLRFFEDSVSGAVASIEDAETLGRDIAARLKERIPSDIFA
ncbi:MAG: hydroxymethylbilane synthase, partial [Micavibrio aeruginosavorus]